MQTPPTPWTMEPWRYDAHRFDVRDANGHLVMTVAVSLVLENPREIAEGIVEAVNGRERMETSLLGAEQGSTIEEVLANYRRIRRTVQDARAALQTGRS